MMRDNYLDISKLTTNPQVLRLFQLVADHGGVLRFVGGAVRDALKGLKGSDLNLATDLSPEELAEACFDEGVDTVPLGIRQGSIGIVLDGTTVEVGSLYKYVTQSDGSVDIEFTDNWEEDASRRDLTINAVYADEQGNVFDYYNGIEDLEKGYVRFIGSATQKIQEDYLRILRYFRFYSLFGLEEPNKKAIDACRENCAGLKKVAMERIRDELFKITQTPNAPRTYRLMQENGILSHIMPDVEHIDDLEFFNQIAKGQQIADEGLVKGFILSRPDILFAENLAARLKLNRHDKQLFVALASSSLTLEELCNLKNCAKIAYYHGINFVQAKLLTLVAQNRTFPDDLWDIYQNIGRLPQPEFPIKGRDIIDAGLSDPHILGQIRKELEQIWVESNFTLGKEQLLAQIDSLKAVI
jgi:poly(A) polymerase